MAQITVFNPDKSYGDAFIISDFLHYKLSNTSEKFELEYLTLALLKELRNRVLSLAGQNSKIGNHEKLTSSDRSWFDDLNLAISRIETLPNPDSLMICISE